MYDEVRQSIEMEIISASFETRKKNENIICIMCLPSLIDFFARVLAIRPAVSSPPKMCLLIEHAHLYYYEITLLLRLLTVILLNYNTRYIKCGMRGIYTHAQQTMSCCSNLTF